MRTIKRIFIITALIFFNISLSQREYLKDINISELSRKTIYAKKISSPPIIDGLLDKEIWDSSMITTDFFQIEPKELSPPSEPTSVRILYDNKSIYVFIEAFDSRPDDIKKTLVRRDSWMDGFSNNADWVGISIDSKNDDYNGIFFGVNSSGAKIDVAVSGDDQYDLTWDGVWDVSVTLNKKSWTAEFELPLFLFQYENKPNMEWGIQVQRGLHRLQETISWPGKPKTVRGIVLPYGVLKGLYDLPKQSQLEVIPYLLSGKQEDYKLSLGLDARYSLTTNSIMRATINPDFGQVEADPSVVNLTAFETFYEEKRPFFTEGLDFFRQRINLFNSRRIGKSPSYNIPDNGELEDVSDFTKILGATKIMGTSNSGINYGFIGAVTSEEKGKLIDSTIVKNHIIEPQTYYSIGRFEFPILNSISRFGLMGTNVSRRDTSDATVYGGDWDLGFFDNKLFSKGQLVTSNSNGILGSAFRFNVGYLDPIWWGIRFWFGTLDNNFNVNDLGYSRRNNYSWSGAMIEFRRQEPNNLFINNELKIFYKHSWNGDKDILEKEIEFKSNNLLKNYWNISLGGGYEFTALNDENLFQDEDAWVYETESKARAGINFKTDRRKNIILGGGNGFGFGKNRGWGYRRELELEYKPFESLMIEAQLTEDFSPNAMQYVEVLRYNNDTVRVYAESKLLTRDLSLRLNWTFTPEMTLQCYVQPFFASMEYENFSRLEYEKSASLISYPFLFENENPNFRYSNSIGTFVFRWEYRSGSTIYLVYNLNQENSYSFTTKDWTLTNKNAVYFKINYWYIN